MGNALARLEQKLQSSRMSFKRFREKENNVVTKMVNSTIATGSSFGLAYYTARFPDKSTILGAPVSLVVGGLALLAEISGYAGKDGTEYVGAIATGGLCAYGAAQGTERGAAAADSAAQAA